jgi:hypothetical protein
VTIAGMCKPLTICPPEVVHAEFGQASRAPALIETACAPAGYDPAAARTLLAAARGGLGEGWAERRLAVLLLENLLLRLSPGESSHEIHSLGMAGGMRETEISGRMARLKRAHDAIRTPNLESIGWRYFLRVARDVSKLTLARFVFTPAEVVAEVRRHLTVSRGTGGAIHLMTGVTGRRPVEAPDYEAAILDLLCTQREIFWVTERCGAEINALVEYPLTSAVVVVKPPGSDWEIEIKRAGTRGPRLLDVIHNRGGVIAPLSHRLFGASLGWLGAREGKAVDYFSRVYRYVHGRQSPCSHTAVNTSVVTLPSGENEIHLLDYLNESGPGTQEAMRECVRNFPSETGVPPTTYSGALGLTLDTIGQMLPQQAIIFGSSSFRLDRIALYLSERGAESYFHEGLGRGYTIPDARWLADSVLEEILGEVDPPNVTNDVPYEDYGQYVRDAFAMPSNRRRADVHFVSVLRQIGECWGTLLAMRGFTDGESFVLRNVGLKSVYAGGEWQVRLIFMDHDDLILAASRYPYFWPTRELSGMDRDLIHILGGAQGDHVVEGEVRALESIYRVDAPTAEAGVRAMQEALVAAYRATQTQIDTNVEFRAQFYGEFLNWHRDFDHLYATLLRTDPSQQEQWNAESRAYLRGRGWGEELIDESLYAVTRFRPLLERLRFLFLPD